MRRTLIAATASFVVLTTIAVGCSDTTPTGDAGTKSVDDSPAHVVNMPNGFMNIAFKCMGVNGIYAHTRTAAPVVVPNDPECRDDG
jgi:hypothetical protein